MTRARTIARPITMDDSAKERSTRNGNGTLRPGAILFKTFEYLRQQPSSPRSRRIRELHLTRYFTTAETAAGSVGAAMSYYEGSDEAISSAEHLLRGILGRSDGTDITVEALTSIYRALSTKVGLGRLQASLLMYAVVTAVVSAWSAPVLTRGLGFGFSALKRLPANWAGDAEAALVVGFGGMLEACLINPTVGWVHISDLCYYSRREEIAAKLDGWRVRFPCKRITAGPAMLTENELAPFDCICVSGSTLCNGTLEPLISLVRQDARLFMHGQSASIYPRYLFDVGFRMLITSIKPRAVSRAARGDRDGLSLRPLLEGSLPWIHVAPTRAATGKRDSL